MSEKIRAALDGPDRVPMSMKFRRQVLGWRRDALALEQLIDQLDHLVVGQRRTLAAVAQIHGGFNFARTGAIRFEMEEGAAQLAPEGSAPPAVEDAASRDSVPDR